jgi:hypothetical protein
MEGDGDTEIGFFGEHEGDGEQLEKRLLSPFPPLLREKRDVFLRASVPLRVSVVEDLR